MARVVITALAILALVSIAPGVVRAEPAVGTFQLEFGDGNRVYTFGKDRRRPTELDDGTRCRRPHGGLNGTLKTECSVRLDDRGVKGKLRGPLTLILAGEGPQKSISSLTEMKGRLTIEDEGSGRAKMRIAGTRAFRDGERQFFFPRRLTTCFRGFCRDDQVGVEMRLPKRQGLWKLKLKVEETEPGVLGGKAVASLYQDKVKYRIEGIYEPPFRKSTITLVGKEKPNQHQIDLFTVRVAEGRVTGRIDYDLFGQSGSTFFDVPIESPPPPVVEEPPAVP